MSDLWQEVLAPAIFFFISFHIVAIDRRLMLRQYGLPKGGGGFVFHDTRRCALTNAQEAGIPDSVARTISGHRTDSAHRRYLLTQEAA